MAEVVPRAATVSGAELETVRYDSDGFSVPAYLAKPPGSGPFPGVIIGQEAFGPTKHIEDVAANLAAEGYIALSPDYYARTGPPEPQEDIPTIQAAIDRIDNPTILRDYRAGIDFLVSQGLATPHRIGTMGFCTGGTYSMILAIETPGLACAVLFYVSQLEYQELSALKPYHPIDRAGDVVCPALYIFGDADEVATPDRLAKLKSNMAPASELRIYEGGTHAFLNPDAWLYHEGASRQAWPEALDYLRRHLAS